MDQSFSFVILFVCTTLINCHFNWLVVQCQQTINRCPQPFEFSTIINASPSFEGIVYVCMIVYNGLFWIVNYSLLTTSYYYCLYFAFCHIPLCWTMIILAVYLICVYNFFSLVGRAFCYQVLLWQENSWMPWRWRRWAFTILISPFFVWADDSIFIELSRSTLFLYIEKKNFA